MALLMRLPNPWESTVNNARRKTIAELVNRLTDLEALAAEIAQDIADVQSEEQEAFDNLSEGLQASERGQQSEAAADALAEAQSTVEDISTYAQEAISSLESAAE